MIFTVYKNNKKINSDVTDSTAFELKRRSRGQGMGIRSHVLNAKDEKGGSFGQCWRWRGRGAFVGLGRIDRAPCGGREKRL